MNTGLLGLRSALTRRRDRALWRSPQRALQTLRSFASTEDDGGRDLVAAARRTSDPILRGHLERHAADEIRHGTLFRERAEALAAEQQATGVDQEPGDRRYDLERARGALDVDAHGFFKSGLYDELGEVAYVAMLHVAEQRAAELFAHHERCLAGVDEETAEILRSILKDEKYHVAYTGTLLEQWRGEGREREVREALRRARSSRALLAWKQLGLRSAAGFGQVFLWVAYWTLFAPFALLGRGRPGPKGWQTPETGRDLQDGQA